MPSTCAISYDFWASLGKTELPMQASCPRQACQACLPSSPRDACAGLDTCAEWRMATSPRTSCMESSPQESGQPCATRMSARRTSRHVASTQLSLRQKLRIEPDGDQRSRMASNWWKRGERASGKKRDSASDRDFSLPLPQPPSRPLATSATSAIAAADLA